MSETHKATLEKANAAVAAGDNDAFLAFCTDDTEWTIVGDRTLKGKAAVRQWLADSYAEPPENDVARMIADGDFLAVHGELTAKDKHGRATRSSYCDVWRFRDGKLAELTAYVVATKAT